ncbi:MAG: hypothetical protein DRJ10_19430 [Bacteroidetes bacterium]|nr:MAG: hypothetical protein DRJ10_19430 [Bacteroidota bacterium]
MMKKQNLLLSIAFFAIIGIIFSGCEKDDPPTPITGEALFEYSQDGYAITFTNTSTISGASFTYAWDFGDGKGTSTDENPVYTYDTKGEYTVMLTVTDEQDGTHPIATKINVAKSSPIKLDDDSVADWDGVTGDGFVVPLGDNSGITLVAKFDYDAEFVYAYVEFEGNISDAFHYDMFFDTDNLLTTGSTVWLWPGTGSDFLFEYISLTGPDEAEIAFFDFTGTPGSDEWDWTPKDLADGAYILGTLVQKGANIAVEFGFSRSKIPGFDGDMLAMGLLISNVDWAEVGFSPDAGQDGDDPLQVSFMLNME